MSVAGQAVNPASVLCRFLNEVLPERQLIAEEWDKQAAETPWSGVAVDGDRRGLGLAAEMRIRLDLAVAPGYRDLLSFLPPGEYDTLLRGAGYIPAEYEHLADTGTEDPLLLEWARSWQPIALDDGQRAALATCCDVAQMHDLTDSFSGYSVQLRRSFFVHLRTDLGARRPRVDYPRGYGPRSGPPVGGLPAPWSAAARRPGRTDRPGTEAGRRLRDRRPYRGPVTRGDQDRPGTCRAIRTLAEPAAGLRLAGLVRHIPAGHRSRVSRLAGQADGNVPHRLADHRQPRADAPT